MPENSGQRHAADVANDCHRPPQIVDLAELKLLLLELASCVPNEVSDGCRNQHSNQNSQWFEPAVGLVGTGSVGLVGVQGVLVGS